MGSSRRWLTVVVTFLMAAAMAVAAPGSVPQARAATLEVGITGCDDGLGNPYCTISAAVAAAAGGVDDIQIIEAGTYLENVVIDRNIVITGTGAGSTIVDGGGVGRVFDVEAGVTATLADLDIVNGAAINGGGVQVQAGAALTATGVTVANNAASGDGGGIYVPEGGQLTLNGGSVVTGNSSSLFGAGAYLQADFEDAIVISDVTFDNNDHPTDKAGSLWLQATCLASCGARQVLIQASTFSNNDTQNGGGGIWANAAPGNEIQITDVDFIDNTAGCPAFGGGCGEGGALVIDNGSGSVVVSDSRFHGNVADYWGGAIANYGNLAIVDSVLGSAGVPGILSNRMDSVDPSFSVGGGAIAHIGDGMTISGSWIEGNFSNSDAGGIYTEGSSLTITDSLVGTNVAEGNGGGIFGFAPVTLTDSLVFDNRSGTLLGGGESGLAGYGGGIYAREAFDITTSGVIGNIARGGEGGGVSSFDGASVTIASSTISDNQAITGSGGIGNGGGISNNGGGSSVSVSINSSTVAFNSASGTGGGTFNTDSFGISNTILANNTSGEPGLDNDNCAGTVFNDLGYNLLDNLSATNAECGLSDGVNGNQVGTGASPIDPALGPLSVNVFTDGFETYPSACCQTSFGSWNVTGDIDILGPGFTSGGLDQFCRGAQCLDLGGSLAFAQPVLSRTMGALDPGTYLLSFDLAGSQRLSSETTVVTVVDDTGVLYTDTLVKAPFDRFTTTTVTFDKLVTGDATVSFTNLNGADNEGALLDRVRVARVDGAHAIASDSPAVNAANPAAPGSGIPACELNDQLGQPRLGQCDIGAFEVQYTIQGAIDAADPGDTVNVPAGTFFENITIGDGKTLEGAGPSLTVIDGDGGRTVDLLGDATLRSLTVQNGSVGEGIGGNIVNIGFNLTLDGVEVTDGFADLGGNVYSDGALTITGSTISDGQATSSGAGIYTLGSASISGTLFSANASSGIEGGAIYVSDSDVTISSSQFVANDALTGGAIYGDSDSSVTIGSPGACAVAATDLVSFVADTTFVNHDVPGGGAAIYTLGTLEVHQALFDGNVASLSSSGGAINTTGDTTVTCSAFGNNGGDDGGAILSRSGVLNIDTTLFEANSAFATGGAVDASGTVSVANSRFVGNIARNGGGMSVTGASTLTESNNFWTLNDANDVGGAISATVDSFVSSGSTFDQNTAFGFDADGGAIRHAGPDGSISGANITANTASGAGGGIASAGTLTIDISTVTGNDAFVGGGIDSVGQLSVTDSTVAGNTANFAGGISSNSDEIILTSSTVSGNSATQASDTAGGGLTISGGGVITNSTISGNVATTGGAGAMSVILESVEIHNSTIVSNSAAVGSITTGGIHSALPGLVQIGNSIVGLNRIGAGASNCSEPTTSLGYNVFESTGCGGDGVTDQEGGDGIDLPLLDPDLGPLQDNGGSTETHALLAGSPALDMGDPGSGAVVTGATAAKQIQGSTVAPGTELVLTTATGQAGSAFSLTPVDLGSSFTAEFDFQITPLTPIFGQPSADGLTFAITDSPFALGDGAGRLGIGDPIGGPPASYDSVSVEFDTFPNGFEVDNHVGINVGSDIDPAVAADAIASEVSRPVPGAFDDGAVWTAWVDYDAILKRLEVRIATDGVRPADSYLSYDVDLLAEIPLTAYVGFTAGTGAASAEHRILDWSFTEASTCTSLDQRGVPRLQGNCDVGAFELAAGFALSLDLNSAGVVPTGASTIATTDLPSELATQPTDPNDPTDDNIGSAPIANLDAQSAETESSPIANLPIANLDVAGAPIANLPIANLPASAQSVIDAILLSDVPITGGWDIHLDMSPTLANRGVDSVTFGQAMADEDVLASLEANEISFNDMNLVSTPIANLTIAGLALGNLPIANLSLDLTAWCLEILGDPVDCVDLGIVPGTDDGGHSLASLSIAGADVSTLPIANIPIANLDTAASPIANLPIANLPIANLVIEDSPIANLPIANLPIANLAANSLGISELPIANLPIANLGVANLPIANLPIANLDATGPASLPIANLFVENAAGVAAPIANLPIANLTTVGGLPIANLGPDGLPIANLPIANLPIANIPIANLAGLVDCSQPAVFDCDAPGATVGGAFLAGLLMGNLGDWAGLLSIQDLLDMGVTDGAAGPILTFADFVAAFDSLTLGDLVEVGGFANLGEITLAQLAEYAGMTLGELLIAMIQAGLDFVLGDVLLLLVNPEDYPWEDLDLEGVDLQSFDLDTSPTVFRSLVDVAGGGGAPGVVVTDLPAGFLFTGVDVFGPGGVQLNYTFSATGQTVVVNVASIPNGVTAVEVSAAASLSVGVAAATSTATVSGVEVMAGTVITVAEVFEPNDIPETATPAVVDTLYLTHIAEQYDVDLYKIPDVQPGSRISVILSNMSEDFDLVLYQPELPPLRPGGVIPEGIATGVSDPGGFVDGDEQLQNEVSGDFPRAVYTVDTPIVDVGQPLKLYETSTQQGTSDEVITTATLQAAGDYFVQVHGNNGLTSLDPYALRVEVIESPTSLACLPLDKPFDGQGNVGSDFTAGPGPYNTLILFNEKRMGDMYGVAAANNIRDELHDLAGLNALGVNAIVVAVDAAVSFTDWDGDRCNPLAANEVAAQIGQLVDDYRAANPTIEYITVVGDDAQIPFFRVPDYTEIANESEYALSVSSTNNELVGSLLSGFILTDDPYGDAHPLLVDGRELYISELAMGRLVETPAQILTSIGHFSTFNGRLDPDATSTGLATGYDFIEDAAIGIQAALDTDPRRTTETLNSDTLLWNRQDLINSINTLSPNVLSLGAHMSHDSLLTALEDNAGSQADLYTTTDAANQTAGVFERRIIFSMGCHSGLSLSGVQVGDSPDWAEQFSELGAVYAAETGFGYGDTEFLAYGEELMRQFSLRLNGSMSVGQAMVFAKQFHAANLSQLSTYDEKVIMETVVYGLPFYAIGFAAAPPAPPAILPSSTDPITGLTVVSSSFDFAEGGGSDGDLVLQTTADRGEFYTAQRTGEALGEAQVTAFNPIQPKAIADVTQPGLVGTGVFISELTSVDIPDFDPVFSRPTVDLAAREPELSLPGTFPIVLPGINTYLDQTGGRDQLVVVLGQFTDTDGFGEVGIERLFTHVKANVLYGDPTDVLLPTIRSVKALDSGVGGFLTFNVDAFDLDGSSVTPTDVARVHVLYKQANAPGEVAWTPLDLTLVGGRWVGTAPGQGVKVQFIVQAIDFNGLVAVHSNKTAGNQSTDAPVPQPGGVDVVINGGVALPVYVDPTDATVEIEIDGADPDGAIQVDVDGGGFEPYEGPFDVTGDGPHTVTVTDGTDEDSVTFIIDTMPPAIFITSPVDGALYETGTELLASFSCTDAGVGVDTCDGTLNGTPINMDEPISTAAAGVYTLEVVASDGISGHDSSESVTFEIAAAPVLTVAPLLVPVNDTVTATVAFSPDGGHAHTVTWDWGDGTANDICTASDCVDEPGGTSDQTHQYADPGVYLVTATISHAGFGTQVVVSDFIVVYDPSAGFVTGGGWFDSPFGAYTPTDPLDAEVTGRAHFGFVSKYKKGQSVPTGNTTFRLDGNGFRFASTSYEWLVVSGTARAQFQGVGTIAGWPGEYSFRVTLRDADGNDTDAFTEDSIRVRIWQDDGTEEGWLVYDNGYGQDEDAGNGGTTNLGGGSIVIHVPKGKKGGPS